jgi:leucyl aminopeptidase
LGIWSKLPWSVADAENGTDVDKVRVIMNVSATTQPATATIADTIAVGIFQDEETSAGLPDEATQLIASGEARGTPKALALAHAGGRRWLLVGLGKRRDFTPERARTAAAGAHARALELATETLCWRAPSDDLALCGALVEGTALADYRFDRLKSAPPDAEDSAPKHLQALIVAAPGAGAETGAGGEPGSQAGGGPGGPAAADLERTVAEAATVAAAANAARDLQNRPANDLTPAALAEHARALAQEIDGLTAETDGREGIVGRGMGAFAAVAQGSEQEPALIVLRYEHPDAKGPVLGLVGKAVTFDSGGISLKPGAKMAEMKFDMSGGAAVIEAVGAIARLQLPVKLIGVVGATENLPSGRAVKPGDVVTAGNGKTIEVNNTDAEGRLVLADCLHHAVGLGAERVVDLATLTGAVIVALGSTYAGLMSNDDELAQRIAAAGEKTGEIAWRLPLHAEYDELIEGTYGDLDNAPEARKAGTIVGGAFLQNFVADTPWAHLDIAGSAWDLGRAYVGKGASGYGVRLLVELARSYAA